MVNNVWVSLGNGACGFIDASGEVALVGEYDDQNRIVCLDGQAGWRAVGGKLFYFDPEDKGVLRTGWFEVDGLHYYADASGIKQVGWVSVSGTGILGSFEWGHEDRLDLRGRHLVLSRSTTGAMQTGWLHENGEWYYLKNSGAMTANSSVRISDGTYWYMNGSGRHDRQAGIDIIMRTARSLLGVPYVWLGCNIRQDGGMDCASFTWYLYKQLGN